MKAPPTTSIPYVHRKKLQLQKDLNELKPTREFCLLMVHTYTDSKFQTVKDLTTNYEKILKKIEHSLENEEIKHSDDISIKRLKTEATHELRLGLTFIDYYKNQFLTKKISSERLKEITTELEHRLMNDCESMKKDFLSHSRGSLGVKKNLVIFSHRAKLSLRIPNPKFSWLKTRKRVVKAPGSGAAGTNRSSTSKFL
jgi:hypothetical protein